MKTLYVTADRIGTETGGGAVTINELAALRAVSDVAILSRDEIEPSKFRQPDSPFLQDYFALCQITSLHFDFDLAHFYSGCFSQTIRWLKERGTKVTHTVAAHDRKITIEEFGRVGIEYPFHHIKDDDLWKIYTEGIRLADVVIAPSTKSAEFLKSGVGCKNVVVIPHGVNLPKKVKPVPERFDVGYLGQCGPDKGLIYLIQAWGMLNYSDSRLILAGDGTETLGPFISQLTDGGQFVTMGRIPDMSDLYNACSVYVQPSVTEAFGIEILEAMAHSRPVIASEGAGASEIITHGLDGVKVPIRDPGAIAEMIDMFRENKGRILEMGRHARWKVRKYTWSRIRKRYEQLFLALQAGG